MDTFAIGEAEVKKRYTFAEETIAEYERIGISSMPRPKITTAHGTMFPDLKTGSYYDGRMPLTLRQLSLDEVSMMLGLVSNWYGYLSAQYAIVNAKRSEAKRKRDAVWSIVRNWYRKVGKKHHTNFSDQKCSDFARQDARFAEVEESYERLNVLQEALYALVEHTKKECDVVSREITIRQTKLESEARQRGVSNRFSDSDRRRANATQGNVPGKIGAKIGNPLAMRRQAKGAD